MSSVFSSVCTGQCSSYEKKNQVVFLIPEDKGTKILHFIKKHDMPFGFQKNDIKSVVSCLALEVRFSEHLLSLFETRAR